MTEPLVTVKVKGLGQLEGGMAELADHITTSADQAFLDIAAAAAMATAARLPHRTGRLASTVRARFVEGKSRARVAMGQRLAYGGWVEFGGGRYKGRPYIAGGRYLYPLARKAADNLQPAGERAAEREIARMHWPRPES